MIMPDKHTLAPPVVKALTELKKTKLIEIASQSDVVKTRISGEYNVSFQWVAINKTGGTISGINYDAIEKGIPDDVHFTPESMDIYPAVVFKSRSWMVSVAVDLDSSEIKYSYFHPVRDLK